MQFRFSAAASLLMGLFWGLLVAIGMIVWTPAALANGLRVVATTGMIADTASLIAGDRADVTVLMGPGVDPHGYRQTQSDIATLVRADLVLWHGLYLEAQLEDFLVQLSARVPVIAVGEAVPPAKLLAYNDHRDRFDPHVWMDPALWQPVTIAIAGALSDRDPAGADGYTARAETYLTELSAARADAVARLSTINPTARVLITAHDAFGYFGRAYGFEVQGIQGISTESEAGLRRITELVDLLVTRGIGAVFVESSVSDRNVRALIEGAAARGHTVRIGGELFSDAMGPAGAYEGTYLGMIDHNVTVITRALGGDSPVTGRLGRLGAGQ
jgi:manganese/zinc/iron transport system substrate-binding protein